MRNHRTLAPLAHFASLAAIALALCGPSAAQQPEPAVDAAVRDHVRALEGSFREDLETLVAQFDAERFAPSFVEATTEEERSALLARVREAAGDAGDVLVDATDEGFLLTLAGARRWEVAFSLEDSAPYRITALEVHEAAPERTMALDRAHLSETFDRLEADGYSGVVLVRLGGEVVLERPFGMANEELGLPVRLDTVFGTGSRPIDYTKAAIYLLEQQGRIRPDDTIGKYFDDVPDDKATITIRHLMTGRSGLRDFFHTEEDWDPDLAWVDRESFVRRVLDSELLFAPGTDERHSHGAFGILAALIEKVSGQEYEAFLREHFFEPAGMSRTGSYGDARSLTLADFAVGGGPSRVGLPNIPPNWGPTSWLVMGSGGMYSTLPDLLRFYDLLRSEKVLEGSYADDFRKPFVSLDGSDRGFELFQVNRPPGNEAWLMVNMPGHREGVRELMRGLRELVESEP